MNDVRDWLREADPVGTEPPLSELDVKRMRRAIVTAAEERARSPRWAYTSWVAVSVVLVATIAIGVERWLEPDRSAGTSVPAMPRVVVGDAGVAAPNETRRQIQFFAPGGTRVIWVFNADFKP
jgi:hypothetical protein